MWGSHRFVKHLLGTLNVYTADILRAYPCFTLRFNSFPKLYISSASWEQNLERNINRILEKDRKKCQKCKITPKSSVSTQLKAFSLAKTLMHEKLQLSPPSLHSRRADILFIHAAVSQRHGDLSAVSHEPLEIDDSYNFVFRRSKNKTV